MKVSGRVQRKGVDRLHNQCFHGRLHNPCSHSRLHNQCFCGRLHNQCSHGRLHNQCFRDRLHNQCFHGFPQNACFTQKLLPCLLFQMWKLELELCMQQLTKSELKKLNLHCFAGLKFLVRLCTDLGLKDAQEYANKLKKAEKAKELREQVGFLKFILRQGWGQGGGDGSRNRDDGYVGVGSFKDW